MLDWLAALFFLLVFSLLIYFLLENQRRSNRRKKVIRAIFEGQERLLCNGYTGSCGRPSGRNPCCTRGLLTLYQFLRKRVHARGGSLPLAGATLRDVGASGALGPEHHVFQASLVKALVPGLLAEAASWKRRGFVLRKLGDILTLSYDTETGSEPLALQVSLIDKEIMSRSVTLYGEDVDFPMSVVWPGAAPTTRVCLRRTVRTVSEDWSLIRHCYIINDRRRWDRLHAVVVQLESLGLAGSPLNAVMGAHLDVEALLRERKLVQPSAYGRMSRGEIGCFFSHLKAWRKIARQPDGVYAVLEDDVVFKKEFKDALIRNRGFFERRDQWDICTMGATPYNHGQIRRLEGDVYELGSFTGAWAYFLTPTTAQCLCKHVFPITHPVDLVLTVFDSTKYPALHTYDNRFHEMLRMVLISVHTVHDNRWGLVGETSTNQGDSMSSSDVY